MEHSTYIVSKPVRKKEGGRFWKKEVVGLEFGGREGVFLEEAESPKLATFGVWEQAKADVARETRNKIIQKTEEGKKKEKNFLGLGDAVERGQVVGTASLTTIRCKILKEAEKKIQNS